MTQKKHTNTPKEQSQRRKEECARRVVELIRDEPLRDRMGAEGRETVRRFYLIPRLLRDYLALIEEVVLGA